MAKAIKDLVFSVKYGETQGKPLYQNTTIGRIIKCDNGSLVMKLDFIPTNLADGVIMVFDRKEKPAPKPAIEDAPF